MRNVWCWAWKEQRRRSSAGGRPLDPRRLRCVCHSMARRKKSRALGTSESICGAFPARLMPLGCAPHHVRGPHVMRALCAVTRLHADSFACRDQLLKLSTLLLMHDSRIISWRASSQSIGNSNEFLLRCVTCASRKAARRVY
jgi:hypothetical protein